MSGGNMKRYRLALLIGLLVFSSVLTVLAQSDAVKQYTSKDIDWRVHEKVDYQAEAKKGPNSFLNVSTDTDSKIYVDDFTNVLMFDAKTGKSLGTIFDSTGTIQRYDDIAATGDGNFWISDSNSAVYRVDPTGKILSTVAFKTSPGFGERTPGELEVDSAGNLYVSYGGTSLFLQVFSPQGDYIRTILSGVDKLQGVGHFVIAPDDTIYFLGFGIGKVTEENGKVVVQEFAPEFMKERNFIQYRGLAVDADENVYFSAGSDPDKATSIYKLDKNGKLVAQYGIPQDRENWGKDFGTDELSFTVSIALAFDGALVISDTNNIYSQLIKVDMQKPS
jgi:hypothetical protein